MKPLKTIHDPSLGKPLTPLEAAAAANVSRTTIFRAMREKLPAIRVGRRTLIARSDLDAWLASHRVVPSRV